jgi:hypothetical protein
LIQAGDDLVSLFYDLDSQYRNRATWILPNDVIASIRLLIESRVVEDDLERNVDLPKTEGGQAKDEAHRKEEEDQNESDAQSVEVKAEDKPQVNKQVQSAPRKKYRLDRQTHNPSIAHPIGGFFVGSLDTKNLTKEARHCSTNPFHPLCVRGYASSVPPQGQSC